MCDNQLEEVVSFLEDLVHGSRDLTRRVQVDSCEGPVSRVIELVNEFVAMMHETLTSLGSSINEVSFKEAQNSFQLKKIAQVINEQYTEISQVVGAVEQVSGGTNEVASAASAAAGLARDLYRISEEGFTVINEAVSALGMISQRVTEAATSVNELGQHSGKIGEVVEVISEVAEQTSLLSLNAAIEAAHAGDKGRGFAVVADEVRKLADRSATSTREITRMIKQVQKSIKQTTEAIKAMSEVVERSAQQAAQAANALGAIEDLVKKSTGNIETIAATSEEQSAAMQTITNSIETLANHARLASDSTKAATDIQLGQINEIAQGIIGRFRIGSFADKIRDLALAAAGEVEEVIDRYIKEKRLSPRDIFDTNYIEVKGDKIRQLARIFDVSKVPPSGFNPPKYTTLYDPVIDMDLIKIIDKYYEQLIALQPGAFTAVVDLNGFLIAHVRDYRKDWTGDPAKDMMGNRIKRFFEDPVSIRSARAGLKGAEKVPLRASRADFKAHGIDLSARDKREVFLLQTYARDTGEVFNDLSVPVYVLGEHWGAVRVAFRPQL